MQSAKRKLKFASIVLAFIGISIPFWSCYYDSKEFLFPDISVNCDTSDFSYSGAIEPMLQDNCLSCHNASSARTLGGNINLEGYNNVKIRADEGSLYGAISHQSGYSFMPKGASKLDDCTIDQVKKWIDGGSLNN